MDTRRIRRVSASTTEGSSTERKAVTTGKLEEIGEDAGSGDYVYRINLAPVPEGGPYRITVKVYGSSYDRALREGGIKIRSGAQSEPIVIRPRNTMAEPLKPTRGPMTLGRVFPQTSFQNYRPSFEEVFENL